MNWRFFEMKRLLALLAVAVLAGIVTPQTAEAGLFGCFKKKSYNACCPDPCCEPAPSCCAPVAPTCCAPAPVTCCAPEPVCCAPEPVCCDPCAQPRCGLFGKLFKKFRRRRSYDPCCAPEPTCCAPAPTCCAPAPSYCAPVSVAPSCCAPTCCAPAPPACGPCGY